MRNVFVVGVVSVVGLGVGFQVLTDIWGFVAGILVDAARSLMLGGTQLDTAAIWQTLAWCSGLLVVLVPLAVRKYRRVA